GAAKSVMVLEAPRISVRRRLVDVNRGAQRARAYCHLFGPDYAGTGTDLHAVDAGWRAETSAGTLLAAAAVAARDVTHPHQLAVLVEQAHPTTHDAPVTGHLD